MAKQLVQLTIFISGPSETDSEKAALRRVVDELSRLFERTHGIVLHAIGWPHDIRPGIADDPQAEINRQIALTYDIYLGILGARFGTPTPRAGSGTEEEFEEAVAAFRRDTRQLRVLCYFKRSLPDAFSVDPAQLQKVQAFREGLAGRGVLYRDFNDTADFVDLVKDHLHALIVDEWHDGKWTIVTSPAVKNSTSATIQDQVAPSQEVSSTEGALASTDDADDEPGLLDYMSAFQEAAVLLGESLVRLARHTDEMTHEINARTAEATQLQQQHERERHIGGSRAQQQFVANAKNIVNRAAKTLNQFADSLAAELEHFRSSNRVVFVNLELAKSEVAAGADGSARDPEEFAALAKLLNSMETTQSSVGSFEASIRRLPGLTGELKRARRRVSTYLGNLIAELSFSIGKAKTILKDLGPPDAAA